MTVCCASENVRADAESILKCYYNTVIDPDHRQQSFQSMIFKYGHFSQGQTPTEQQSTGVCAHYLPQGITSTEVSTWHVEGTPNGFAIYTLINWKNNSQKTVMRSSDLMTVRTLAGCGGKRRYELASVTSVILECGTSR